MILFHFLAYFNTPFKIKTVKFLASMESLVFNLHNMSTAMKAKLLKHMSCSRYIISSSSRMRYSYIVILSEKPKKPNSSNAYAVNIKAITGNRNKNDIYFGTLNSKKE